MSPSPQPLPQHLPLHELHLVCDAVAAVQAAYQDAVALILAGCQGHCPALALPVEATHHTLGGLPHTVALEVALARLYEAARPLGRLGLVPSTIDWLPAEGVSRVRSATEASFALRLHHERARGTLDPAGYWQQAVVEPLLRRAEEVRVMLAGIAGRGQQLIE